MSEIDKEQNFILMLQALVRAAHRNQNSVSEDELADAFRGMKLSKEQMQTIRDYLLANGIGIDAPGDPDNNMSEEDHDYLQDYEDMVAGLEVPDADTMDAVKINAMAGVKQAQDELATYMLPKVVDIAKLYRNQGVFLEDLIGTGNEELARSVKLLAPLEGPDDVEGFLAERIMNAMENLVESNVEEKAADADAEERANKVLKAADSLSDALGRKVTPLELAAEGDVTLDEIMDAIRLTGNKIDSLDYRQ